MILIDKKTPQGDQKKKPPFQGQANGVSSGSNGSFNGGASNSGSRKSSYNNQCLLHPNSSHLTRKCRLFLQKTIEERGKVVKDANACKLCLSVSHVGNQCPLEQTWGPCNVSGCKEHHSRLVSHSTFIDSTTTTAPFS